MLVATRGHQILQVPLGTICPYIVASIAEKYIAPTGLLNITYPISCYRHIVPDGTISGQGTVHCSLFTAHFPSPLLQLKIEGSFPESGEK